MKLSEITKSIYNAERLIKKQTKLLRKEVLTRIDWVFTAHPEYRDEYEAIILKWIRSILDNDISSVLSRVAEAKDNVSTPDMVRIEEVPSKYIIDFPHRHDVSQELMQYIHEELNKS